jgi:PKD repeat protein
VRSSQSAPGRRAAGPRLRALVRRRRAWALVLAAGILLFLVSAAAADPPTVGFSASPTVPTVGQAVTFTGTATDADDTITSVTWNFGDGASTAGTSTSASHAYATPGVKTVTMSATNSAGQTTTAGGSVRVNAPPTARIVFSTVNARPGQALDVPLVGQQVAFAGTTSSDPEGPIAAYSWDLGGNGTFGDATGPGAVATYTTAGDKTVHLRVTDGDGATDVATVTFRVNRPPVAGFTFSPQSPASGATVHFTSTATDPDGASDIVALDWDLNGDGNYGDASGPAASTTFGPGTHAVGLRVTDSGGATAFAEETVTVPGGGSGSSASGSSAGAGSSDGSASSGSSRPGSAALPVLQGVRVEIAGTVTAEGTRITRLVVVAPRGALVTAGCRGGRCRLHTVRLRVGRTPLHVRRFERSLRSGARLTVVVSRRGFVGRTAVFTIRSGKPPLRRDACMLPGARSSSRCPAT